MGKHSSAVTSSNTTSSNRRPVFLSAICLLVLALGAAFMVRAFGSQSGPDGAGGAAACDDPTQVSLSTTPELQGQLDAAAKALADKSGDASACVQFTITAVASKAVAEGLASGGDSRPDLWVPDSSLWVDRADDGQSVPTVAVPSIATSPLVLVGQRTAFPDTGSWLGAFEETSPAVLDPLSTAAGATALLAIQGERDKTKASDAKIASVLVPLSQRLASMAKAYTDVNGLFSKAAAEGSSVVVPATEQSFVQYQEQQPDSGLKAVVPDSGTLMLDYPVVVTAKSNIEAVSDAAKQLAAELLVENSAQSLDEAGFRSPLLSPLSGGRGVGEVSPLPKPSSDVVKKTLQQWAMQSVSANSLVVIDVSGSMAERVGAKTRMQLTIEAATAGLAMFPNSASLGLWTFSTRLQGNADWKPLVRIAPLAPPHRQRLLTTLKSQTARVGGGTGLYETAIAAVRTVRDNYDPQAVNTVLLFTDGKNDDPGSPGLEQAILTLEGLRDPARPVRIIAIGIGPDTDSAELTRLARATGGRSYIARNPNELKAVFIDAVQNR